MSDNVGRDGTASGHQQAANTPFRSTFYQQSSKDPNGRLN